MQCTVPCALFCAVHCSVPVRRRPPPMGYTAEGRLGGPHSPRCATSECSIATGALPSMNPAFVTYCRIQFGSHAGLHVGCVPPSPCLQCVLRPRTTITQTCGVCANVHVRPRALDSYSAGKALRHSPHQGVRREGPAKGSNARADVDMHRVRGVLHRVLGVAHRVLGVQHRVGGVHQG